MNIIIKDQYPFAIHFSTQQGNSNFLRNWTGASFQFDPTLYLIWAKERMLKEVVLRTSYEAGINSWQAALEKELSKLTDLNKELSKTDVLQKLVEESESINNHNKPDKQVPELVMPSFLKDKKKGNGWIPPGADKKIETYNVWISRRKTELDSIAERISALQKKTDSARMVVGNKYDSLKTLINKVQNVHDLSKINDENGLIGKWGFKDRFIANIKAFSIGRSFLNYSELTAWNIAVSGVNFEYASGFYAAVAAGKIDYGSLNYLFPQDHSKQSLLIGRLGVGDINKRAVIFSLFTGRKLNLQYSLTDSIHNTIPVHGYSIEGILKKNEATYISAELAKSAKPYSTTSKEGSLWDYSDKSNEAFNIKGQLKWPLTNTIISGFYKRMGSYFQAFTLLSYNSDQQSWNVKASQSLFKNRFNLVAMLRQNDYTNPYTEKTFKTSTLFKSVQITMRIPKYPTLSLGYYPGTQLYLIDGFRLRENGYQILNGTVVYTYKLRNNRALSTFNYNNYSAKGTDSGFISYNGVSYLASQSFIFRKLQLNTSYAHTELENMNYNSLEAGADIILSKIFKASGAVKWNQLANGEHLLGEHILISMEAKLLGSLQLQYDKSYLPTIKQSLFPIETGRLGWYKSF